MTSRQIPSLPWIELIPLAEIVEPRPVLLVTSTPAWGAVRERLNLTIAAHWEPVAATIDDWEALLTLQPKPAEVIYAVGGGLVADAGKYIANRLSLPLVVLPTALSVDAFFTPAAGVRSAGCVKYIPTPAPGKVFVDFEIIASAPASLRAAGITDVLSIFTGSWDWKYAEGKDSNPQGMEFIPWVYLNAQSTLQGALDCAEAAGRGDHGGLKQLLDCLCMEVQLCNQVGHARPEEGSEHYFVYCTEQFTGPGWPHADLLGPGILLMSKLQGQDTEIIQTAMLDCNVPLDRIPKDVVTHTLAELPAYCHKHDLPYGIAHTLDNLQNGS